MRRERGRGRWRARRVVNLVGAVIGWLIPVWVLALRGLPVGATARAIAALAGLPPYAAVAVTVTLLLAALQVLAGAWLARAVFLSGGVTGEGTGAQDLGDPQT